MKNEQNNKELESLTKRIRFKSIPVKKTLHGNICLLLLPSPSYWLPAFC